VRRRLAWPGRISPGWTWRRRAQLFEGSWADWEDWQTADLIISNPPYIASAEIAGLAPEVRTHDPMAALDGGLDGLAAYREIVSLAATRLRPGAWLVFEIGHDQKDAVCRLLEMAEFTEIGSSKDLGGNDRAVWGRKPE
jgi:release factor glutamine methyltransferase